jgi:hypothetical protein
MIRRWNSAGSSTKTFCEKKKHISLKLYMGQRPSLNKHFYFRPRCSLNFEKYQQMGDFELFTSLPVWINCVQVCVAAKNFTGRASVQE